MNRDADNEARGAAFRTLVDALIQGWGALTLPTAQGVGAANTDPVPQRAYLLFNRWDGNPLAQGLAGRFPKWVRDRCAVPDRNFAEREEHAPFLLELPDEMLSPAASGAEARAVRDWLAQALESAAEQVGERTTRQDFCGVVVSPASAQAIARHWVGLGDQRPPYQEDSVLFRYHDPRVMQRVWPTLSPRQQSRWLGPVTHWWSLLQPWGPFGASPEPLQWFHAQAPALPYGEQTGGSPRDLFDEPQWFLSGVSPDANAIWRSYADNHIPAQAQPDADSLLQMLADAAGLGLEGANLEDYVWITWMHSPKEGPPRAMDWGLPHLAPTLSRIQAQLRSQPNARFSSLFVQAIQPRT